MNLSYLPHQARIKRILKLDTEVKNVQKEALFAVTKATELFVAYLAVRTSQQVAQRGGKMIRESDMFQTIYAIETLDFLRLDFPRKAGENKMPKVRSSASQAGAGGGTGGKGVAEGHSSIKSFFKSSSVSAAAALDSAITVTNTPREEDQAESQETSVAVVTDSNEDADSRQQQQKEEAEEDGEAEGAADTRMEEEDSHAITGDDEEI